MMPYSHIWHVSYPYFCMFSNGQKTCQKSLGAMLDSLVDTSVKAAKHEAKLQPDLVWNCKQADKLLNLFTAYLSGYVACILFVLFSSPFLQLHFHQEQMLNMKFMNAVWSLVTHQHLCNVQSPVSIASVCVAVTSPSFSPRDSLGIYPLSCLSFLAPSFSPSLSFLHNPSCLWKLLRRTSGSTHKRRIQLSANTIALITGVKNANRWEAKCKNVLMSDVRETKQDVGSDHLNGDQPQWFLLNPVASAVCSDRGSLLHLQALYGRPSVWQGGALTSEPWPWFKPGLVAIDWQTDTKRSLLFRTRPDLFFIPCVNMKPLMYLAVWQTDAYFPAQEQHPHKEAVWCRPEHQI